MSGNKKYDVLWSFCKNAPVETVGRVMKTLAGQENTLDVGLNDVETAFVSMILDDERYLLSVPMLGGDDGCD